MLVKSLIILLEKLCVVINNMTTSDIVHYVKKLKPICTKCLARLTAGKK